MCGIFGLWGLSLDQSHNHSDLQEALKLLLHRGPDDYGAWLSRDHSLFLGHTRLSIQDVSDNGSQPMVSANGRYVICFNGEIYNHLSLRVKLGEAAAVNSWKGGSDTETLLELISSFGLAQALEFVEGMYSFSLLDTLNKKLFLVRDRLGEKPLYYGNISKNNKKYFVFSSELKPILMFPGDRKKISKQAVEQYLLFNYVPSPLSILEGVYKLGAGEVLEVDIEDISKIKDQKYVIKKYWNLADVIISAPVAGSGNTNNEQNLEDIIKSKVKDQLISDVPLGTFLSGGTDSSLITALVNEVSDKPVSSYTIGFKDVEFNEAPIAKKIATILGTNHHEAYLDPNEAINIATEMPQYYDEPFADSSQIPTFLLSRFVSEDISVVLSGDGGDESFGGYNRYIYGEKIWELMSKLPYFLRKTFGKGLLSLSDKNLFRAQRVVEFCNPKYQGLYIAQKARRLGDKLINSKNIYEYYFGLVTNSSHQNIAENSDYEINRHFAEVQKNLDFLSPTEIMMYLDTVTYLCDDICTKVDRASMSSSLEVRAPLLNHHVVESAWSTPLSAKIKNGSGKLQLKNFLKKYIPEELVDTPKKGFSIPLSAWLKNELADWALDIIETSDYSLIGDAHKTNVEEMWHENLSGRKDYAREIWAYLMLLSWLRQYKHVIA